MTAITPGLTVRDSNILQLLREGVSPDRITRVGVHRRSWTAADVQRVISTHLRPPAPAPLAPVNARTPQPAKVRSSDAVHPWAPPPLDVKPFDVYLRPREADVLTALCRGLSNQGIAAALQLSEDTVKTYMKALLLRLGARDRTHAVALVLTGAVTAHIRSSHGKAAR